MLHSAATARSCFCHPSNCCPRSIRGGPRTPRRRLLHPRRHIASPLNSLWGLWCCRSHGLRHLNAKGKFFKRDSCTAWDWTTLPKQSAQICVLTNSKSTYLCGLLFELGSHHHHHHRFHLLQIAENCVWIFHFHGCKGTKDALAFFLLWNAWAKTASHWDMHRTEHSAKPSIEPTPQQHPLAGLRCEGWR